MVSIKEIINDLINDDAKLSNILRKAKILASILELEELKKWTKLELEGYSEEDELPEYRNATTYSYGTFWGPFNSQVQNIQLPSFNLPDRIKENSQKLFIVYPISQLESMIEDGGTSFQLPWPQEHVLLCREKPIMTEGMILVSAWKLITKGMINGILDNVKNKLLDFMIELDESDIKIDDKTDIREKKGIMEKSFQINIMGNNNIVAAGENITQKMTSIKENDIDTLLEYFRDHKVPEDNLEEIKSAIEIDGNIINNEFGPKVKEWIGNMIIKASSGIWKIGLATAPAIITEGLKYFYGMLNL